MKLGNTAKHKRRISLKEWATIIAVVGSLGTWLVETVDLGHTLPSALFAGTWELSQPTHGGSGPRASAADINLVLYPGGQTLVNGLKGTWELASLAGPALLVELPRQNGRELCELKIGEVLSPEKVAGELKCSGPKFEMRRLEPRGFLPMAILEARLAFLRQEAENERRRAEMPPWLRNVDIIFQYAF